MCFYFNPFWGHYILKSHMCDEFGQILSTLRFIITKTN